MGSSAGDSCCADCLGRIPYASLIAFILTCVGVGLFCGMTYQAVNASVDQAKKLNLFQVDILNKSCFNIIHAHRVGIGIGG